MLMPNNISYCTTNRRRFTFAKITHKLNFNIFCIFHICDIWSALIFSRLWPLSQENYTEVTTQMKPSLNVTLLLWRTSKSLLLMSNWMLQSWSLATLSTSPTGYVQCRYGNIPVFYFCGNTVNSAPHENHLECIMWLSYE